MSPVCLPYVKIAQKCPLLKAGLVFAVVFCAIWVDATGGIAALYSFTDERGVEHFTNRSSIERSSRERTHSNDVPQRAVAASSGNIAGASGEYDGLIQEAAEYYSLPVALVKAVIAVESAFEPSAVSSVGASGLMQLLPRTASAMSVSNIFDPRDNVFGGVRYLRFMLNRYNGDIALAVAAYNAGPLAVDKAKGIPPYLETQKYVGRVLTRYRSYLNR